MKSSHCWFIYIYIYGDVVMLSFFLILRWLKCSVYLIYLWLWSSSLSSLIHGQTELLLLAGSLQAFGQFPSSCNFNEDTTVTEWQWTPSINHYGLHPQQCKNYLCKGSCSLCSNTSVVCWKQWIILFTPHMWVLGAGQQAGEPAASQIKSQANFRRNTCA